MVSIYSLAGLLSCTTAALAAVEAHNHLRSQVLSHPDSMSMQVWVDGRLVCDGVENVVLASNETTFCLRNHDGQGKGCATGYAYCTWGNGQVGELEYFKDSKLVHTMRLEEKAFERWEDPLPCLCIEVGDRETCFKCQEHEACVSSSSQNTCKMCGDAKCGDTGKLNPPPSLGYPKQFRAMIAGDSISQGREGDFTWRYRLWEWLRQSDELSVDFVGPWKGTYPPPDLDTAIPRPPPLQGEEPEEQNRPTQGGKYSQGVSSAFPDRHLSRWGQQARQSKSLVWQAVKDHKPVYLLIELGFNDIGWFVSDADGMLRDLKELVHNAQDGNPDIMVFVANIPHRSRIGGRQDLIDETNKANQKLPEAVKKWFRYDSRVFVVDLAGKYNCGSSDCPDGYDGLHPNERGEYHIAQAFAEALDDHLGVPLPKLQLPSSIPTRTAPVPANFRLYQTVFGLGATWDAVFGVYRYDVRARIKGQPWDQPGPAATNAWFKTWVLKDQVWEVQVRSLMADDIMSPWTAIQSVTANPQTPPGPPNVVTTAAGSGIYVKWDKSPYSVERYAVNYYDTDGTDFIQSVGTRGQAIQLNDLTPNHRYIVSVECWSALGGGSPTVARLVRPGVGIPGTPGNFRVNTLDATSVQVAWDSVSTAAGYRVWVRNKTDGEEFKTDEYGTTRANSHEIFFLFPGVWNFEFCVTSYNGNLESARSKCITATRP